MSTPKCFSRRLLVCLVLVLSSNYAHASRASYLSSGQCEASGKEKDLFAAIERRDPKRVAALLAARVNPNALSLVPADSDNPTSTACTTPLMYAAWFGDVEIVKLLLANRARVNLHDNWGRSIWAYAIGRHAMIRFTPTRTAGGLDHRLQLTRLLLAAGASLNKPDQGGSRETAIFHAVHAGVLTGDLRIINSLIAAGAEVNIKGNSVLAYTTLAIQRALTTKNSTLDAEELLAKGKAPGAAAVMKALLAAGANVHRRLGDNTALMFEANGSRLEGTLDRMRLLVAAGADVNAQNATYGQTPLLAALMPYDAVLLSRGSQRDQGMELHDQVEVVSFLLASGADPKKRDRNGDTALHATFHSYNMYRLANSPMEAEKLFKSMIAAGADLNARDAKGRTIIHLLTTAEGFRQEYIEHAEEVRLQLLRLFAASKADFNILDNEKTTPLLAAVKNKLKPEVVRALLAAGANPNLANAQGRTPLMEAVVAITFEDDTVKALLAARPTIDAQDNDGATALLLACDAARRPSIVALLIAAHANVDLPDKTGRTPLLAAAAYEVRHGLFTAESANIVQQLIDAKAGINARNAANDTALMVAIRSGREELVKLLLDAGINLNLTNNDGDSALTIAAKVHGAGRRQSYYYSTRTESLVERLVAAGARVRAINKAGESVLTLMSAKAGRDELPIIQLLIERAAREAPERFVQVEDLLRAVRRAGGKGSAATVKALIAAGGNVNGRSEEGEAMLIVAIEESGNAEVVELLLAAGADVNVRDRNGDTPLLLAIRQYLGGSKAQISRVLRQDPRVIDVLLSFHANPLDRTRNGLTALDLARQSGNEKLISQIQRAQP